MKIGLISFHKEPNYGTMLQAYALAKVLKQEGVEAEYIRYTPAARSAILKRGVKNLLYRMGWKRKGEFAFFHTRAFAPTLQAFNRFHDRHIPVSGKMYYADNIREANQYYNRFMVGSDQTWSPWLNQNPKGIHMLQFVDRDNRKYAYAPSLGTTHPNAAYVAHLSDRVKHFGHLTCRERTNCHLLSARTDRPVDYVLDPTLLLTPSEWDAIAAPSILPRGRYVLAYILGEKPEISAFAERAAQAKGLPVYYLVTRPCYLNRPNALNGIGPDGFISLVRDAALVVTDSFHGTLFSINYGVPFYSFTKRGADSMDNDRIQEILEELGLPHRFRQDNDLTLEDGFDFRPVQERLESLRKESMEALRKMCRQ